MDDATLIRGLECLRAPAIEGAEERCKARLLEATAQSGARRRFLLAHPRLVAALCGVVALVAFGALTAPGQAVAAWLAEQVGMGQPGGAPTLQKIRASVLRETDADGPAYVLVEGPTPLGGHYELITYRSSRSGARCFEFDLTAARSLAGGGCEEGSERLSAHHGLTVVTVSSSLGIARLGYRSVQSIVGLISEDISSVAVTRGGRPLPVTTQEVPPELTESLGFSRPFKTYVAFDTRPFRPGIEIRVRAFDHGRAVARAKRAALTPPTDILLRTCRQARRLADEGKLVGRNARMSCRASRLTIRRGS